MEKTYKYLGYFLLLLVPLTILAFFKTYFVQFPNFKEDIDSFTCNHCLCLDNIADCSTYCYS